MARLPQPGGDEGNWGDILNEYLSVAHSSDGTLKSGVVGNVTLQNNAVTGAKIQNQTITSGKIAASNSPSNGQVLSYNGSGFEWVSVGGGGVVNWGDINGTLSNQGDLQTALNNKSNTGHTHDDRYYTEAETDALLSGKQNANANLTAIAGLSPSNDDILQRKSGAWTNRTPAQFKADLALTKSDVGLANADNTSDANKPISTATQTALDGKANTSHTHAAADITSGTKTSAFISDFDTQVRTNRLDQMAVPTAAISLNGQKITNLDDPENDQEAATKAYVDAIASSDRATATVIVAASDSPQAIKDAADYVADGTADQVEINDALTAAAGGKVYLAEGTYTVTASISVPNNTTLTGAGSGSLIRVPDNHNSTLNIITNSDTATGTRVTISNLRIDGNKANQSSGDFRGILLNGMGSGATRDGAKLSNLWIHDVYGYNIRLEGSSNNIITGNTIRGSAGQGIILTSSSNDNVISNNTMYGNVGNGIMLASTSDRNTVTGNTVKANGGGILIGGVSSASNDNTISGNTIVQNTSAVGIYLQSGSSRNNITGNRLHDNGGGSSSNNSIDVDGASTNDNTITGNYITDTAGAAYAINIVSGSGTFLADNRFGTGANGVWHANGPVNDQGSDTIYANQADGDGNLINRSSGFTLQDTAGANLLHADSSTSMITVGAADSDATLLVLDTKNTAGDPDPGDSVDGAMYYNSDSGKFRGYQDGDWTDIVGVSHSHVTAVVAASDSPQAIKDMADYVADGTADQVEINDALTAAAGGKVYLAEGTYTINDSISVPNNTTLVGAGRGTLITIPDSHNADLDAIINTDTTTGTGITVQSLRLDGNRDNQSSGIIHGLFLTGVGGGSGESARQGAKLNNLWIDEFRSGIFLYNSDHNILSDNSIARTLAGVWIAGTAGSHNNVITGNISQGNVVGLYIFNSTNNTVTNSLFEGNTTYGIQIQSSSHNLISSNRIRDNGSGSTNHSIRIHGTNPDYNTLQGNYITDTAGEARAISVDAGTGTYLSNNRFGTGADGVWHASGPINDSGTGTIYVNQINGDGKLINRSADGLQIQSSSGGNLLNADASDNRITVGAADSDATLLVLDTKNTAGDPDPGDSVDGAMYYNSDSGKFRGYQDGDWTDLGVSSSHTHDGDDITTGTVGLARLGDVLAFVDVVTGSEARPSDAGRVVWIGGSSEPDNMDTGDVWMQEV